MAHSAEVPVPAGYAWAATLTYLRPRALPGIEQVSTEEYRRVVPGGGVVRVRRDAHRRRLLVDGDLDGAAVGRVKRLFDVETDSRSVLAHLSRCRFLGEALRGVRDLRVPGCWDAFELAVRAVLGQQVSVAAASTMMGRAIAHCGRQAGPGYLFPAAEQLAEADLTRIGLTRSRAATVRALARAVLEGRVLGPAAQSLEQRVAQLTAIPGIGPWTAHYIALRGFGHADAFPASDLGLRRAAGGSGGPLDTAELARRSEQWRPWRAYAAMALWQYGAQ